MILGESYVLSGQVEKGRKLIKEGWITAELSKADLRFLERNLKNTLMLMII